MAAWDRVAASGGLGMPLVLAGAGPLSDTVARWARDRDDVSYLGLRDPDQSARLVAGAAAVVAPSVWLETFGLVVVEAMAAGVPAVAAAHGAFTELIDDGVCGVLHQPGNAASLEASLRRVVLDTDHNLALGRRRRRRYDEKFTPETAARAPLIGGVRGRDTVTATRRSAGTRRRLGLDFVDRAYGRPRPLPSTATTAAETLTAPVDRDDPGPVSRLGWGVADQGISSLCNFALGLFVARSFGASSFGAFTLAFVTYTVVINARAAWRRIRCLSATAAP